VYMHSPNVLAVFMCLVVSSGSFLMHMLVKVILTYGHTETIFYKFLNTVKCVCTFVLLRGCVVEYLLNKYTMTVHDDELLMWCCG